MTSKIHKAFTQALYFHEHTVIYICLKDKSSFLPPCSIVYQATALEVVKKISSVQSFSHVRLFATPWTSARQASLSITNSWIPPKPMSELVMPSNRLILCRHLLLLPSIFHSIRVFSNESVLHSQRIGALASASASVLPMNIQVWFPLELTGLISMLSKELSRVFSNISLKASILWCSAFFIVQLSHLYLTTGKTIALTECNFDCKVMSLLFSTLSRFVIAFLPRSKCLLISWLQSPSLLIVKPPQMKSVTVFSFFPYTCHEVMGPDASNHSFFFLMLSFKRAFSLSSLSFIKRLFSSSSLSSTRVVSYACLRHCYFSWQSWFSLSFIQPGIS